MNFMNKLYVCLLVILPVIAVTVSTAEAQTSTFEHVIIQENTQTANDIAVDPLTSRYAVAGPAIGVDGSSDAHLIITDVNGSMLFETFFSSGICTGVTVDSADSIIYHEGYGSDPAGYYMAGTTACNDDSPSDIYLVKADLSGGGVLESRYALARESNPNDPTDYEGRGIHKQEDSLIIVGVAVNKDADGNDRDSDIVLIDTWLSGTKRASETVGDIDHHEQAYDVIYQEIEPGRYRYYVVGSIEPCNGGSPKAAYLVEMAAANLTFKSSWTSSSSHESVFHSVAYDTSGHIVAVGRTATDSNADDILLYKFDTTLTPVFSRTFGGSGTDIAYSVEVTNDGGYLIVGTTDSSGTGGKDVYVIKTDSTGNLEWDQTFGGLNTDQGAAGMPVDGGFLVAGTTGSYSADDNIVLIKTDGTGQTPAVVVDDVRTTIETVAVYKKEKRRDKLLKKLDKVENAITNNDDRKAEKELCKMLKTVKKKAEKEIVFDSAIHIQTDLLNLAIDQDIDLPCKSRYALAHELPQSVTYDPDLFEQVKKLASYQAASEVVEGVHPDDPFTSRYAVAGPAVGIDGSSDVYLLIMDTLGNMKHETYFSSGICTGQTVDTAASIDFDEGDVARNASYFVLGTTACAADGASDIYWIKTGLDGTGLVESRYALARDIEPTDDTDYEGTAVRVKSDGTIIAGIALNKDASGADTDHDIVVIDTDFNGSIQKSATIGVASSHEKANDVAPLYNTVGNLTGYAVVGSKEPVDGSSAKDAYILWLDTVLDVSTSKLFSDENNSVFNSVIVDSIGNVVAVGSTAASGNGGEDVFVVKFDGSHNELWRKTFGGENHDVAFSIRETMDNGYLVTGSTSSFGAGQEDVYVIKMDMDGNITDGWERTFGGIRTDEGKSGITTDDGDYLIAGTTNSFSGDQEIYFIKTDDEGATPEILLADVRTTVEDAVYLKEDFKNKLHDRLDKIEEKINNDELDKAGDEICHFMEQLHKEADEEIDKDWAVQLQSEIVNFAQDNGIILPCGSRFALA